MTIDPADIAAAEPPLPKVAIRPFAQSDREVVTAWLRDAGFAPPDGVGLDWQRLIDDPRVQCRIGFVEQNLRVGFYRLDIAPDRTAELTLVIARPYRRQGFGRALLAAALGDARARGLRRLVAMVEVGNDAARDYFLASGFERAAEQSPQFVHLERLVHTGGRVEPLEITP